MSQPEPYPIVTSPCRLTPTISQPANETRRISRHLCLYCGEPGHLLKTCPSRPSANTTTRVSVTLDSLNHDHCFTVPVTLKTESEIFNIRAMIDSGAAGNFMSEDFAHKNSIPLIRCLSSLAVEAVDGRPLGSGRITHLTARLTLVTGALHQEIMQFYIIPTLHAPVILGLPWLRKHNPSISWQDAEITGWGSRCFKHCLPQIHPLPVHVVEVTDPTPDTQSLPDTYHDLREAFSKTRASQLPPHRPSDCAIELMPGTSPPKAVFSPSLNPNPKPWNATFRRS